jgi:hypothetical protein
VVVIITPDRQLPAGIGKAVEQFLVEEFVAQRAIEALDEPVLLGLARIDVVPLDPVLAGPFQDRPTGKFGSVACVFQKFWTAVSQNRGQAFR